MRWQHFGTDVPNAMDLELAGVPLKELYQMQADVEASLAGLRASEPSPKRRNTEEHIIWISLCQDMIKRLQDIRDAIQKEKEK